MAQIQGGTTYSTGDQVSSTNLNAHVNNAILLPGSIGDQTAAASVNQIDSLTILQAGALKKATIAQIKTATDQDLTGYIKSDGTVPMTADLALFRSTSISGLTAAPVAYVDNLVTSTYVKASTTEVANFSTVAKYLSPELLPFAFSNSLSTNGFQRLPGGLLLQWGSVSSVGGTITVTFPTPFTTSVYTVQITLKGPGSPDNGSLAPISRNWTTTTFDLQVIDQDSSYPASWLAIGR
jgi:hypothetical protein